MDIYEFFIKLIQFTVPPVTTLLAGFLGVKYGLKQFKEQKKINIIEQQLNKFYSPLLAFHKETSSKGIFKLKLKKAGDIIWKSISDEERKLDGFHYIDKEIEYNNKQLREEILPLYCKMVDIFRDNYWLAEEETRQYYQDLVEFVEIWKRWLQETIKPDVARELNHTEDNLKPFYKELELRMDILKKKLTKY